MLTFTVTGADAYVQRTRNAISILAYALARTMESQMQQAADYSRANKLSGDPLHRRSGDLSRAVAGSAEVLGSVVVGKLGVKGIAYAAVHEKGGTYVIPEHTRRVGFNAKLERVRLRTRTGAVSSKAVAMARGIVRAHNATYPERPFLRPSVEENQARIMAALKATAIGVMRGAS